MKETLRRIGIAADIRTGRCDHCQSCPVETVDLKDVHASLLFDTGNACKYCLVTCLDPHGAFENKAVTDIVGHINRMMHVLEDSMLKPNQGQVGIVPWPLGDGE